MVTHKWLYQGKVIKIIDSQTVMLWLDLGFDIWKKVMVRFNKIKACPDSNSVIKFLDQNLNNKKILTQIFKQKDFNGFDRFFAEIYTKPGDIPLKLVDINHTIGTKDRADGLINFNDVLVSQGLASHIQFNKNGTQHENPVQYGPSRLDPKIRRHPRHSYETGDQTDSSRGGSVTEGPQPS